ncbi:MAG: response regulator, partial [Verrucomicrobiales bacterium]|nr:response regulator [Verrucomicrobiales bacterium]
MTERLSADGAGPGAFGASGGLAAEKVRTLYLAKIRHDLRTPINHVIGYCEMLQDEADDPGWSTFLPDLARILEGGKQLLALVSYYFDASRSNLQKLDVHQVQHELRTPLNHIVGYAEMLQEQAVELGKKTVASDLGKICSAAHVLLDLLETHLIRPQTEPAEGRLNFAGVWPAADTILDPGPPMQLEGVPVLVVDDHPFNRDMLERRLRRQGFTVHLAASGAEALQRLRSVPVDLVLLDMVMPEMDGFQVLKQIKADRTLRHLPIIMLSASDEAATAVHCVRMGADDFLPKPCDTTLLLARIESSLAKKRLREMTKPASGYFFDKGTLQSDSPSYVERQADRDLLDGLLRGELCYVLTSRQMGKSSLMVRTAARLRERNVSVIALDLTALGLNVTPDQWYDGLLTRVGRQLRMEDELEEFWLRQGRLSPVQRLFSSLREVVLKQHSAPLAVFVDELDTVRSLPFSTDELFAAIRECYNRRAEDAELGRLTFCLLGVAIPADLVRDPNVTPFSIGRRIELADFTRDEAASLADGFERDRTLAKSLLDRVLYWTNGHPYLTQRFCRAIAQDKTISDAPAVDGLCEYLFLSPKAREEDDNLVFVRKWLMADAELRPALLRFYAEIRQGPRKIRDDDSGTLIAPLRLSGIVRVTDGNLAVRNQIYAQVFDAGWV